MPNHGFIDRLAVWINQQEPGQFFTLGQIQEAMNADAEGAKMTREQVSTAMSRLVRRNVGVARHGQGVYVFNPIARPRRPAKPKVEADGRQMPVAQPPQGDALSIAAPSSVGTQSAYEPVTSLPPVLARTGQGVAALVGSVRRVPTPPVPTPTGDRLASGDVVLLTVLAQIPGTASALAQDAESRKIYRVSEVTT